MPQYLGGKYRVRYQISEYINALAPKVYLEPFCGMCWVGQRVRATERYFSDANEDLVLMWKALQTGWKPPVSVTEEQYALLRTAGPSALRGFVGINCSFGGKWFGGFARSEGRNYADEGSRGLVKQAGGLLKATFKWADYRAAFDSIDADVIYCDPPYAGTTEYDGVKQWVPDVFWDVVRERSVSTTVIVSEYAAPDDFHIVMETESRMGLSSVTGIQKRRECLFSFRPVRRSRVSFASLLG